MNADATEIEAGGGEGLGQSFHHQVWAWASPRRTLRLGLSGFSDLNNTAVTITSHPLLNQAR